ncbi:hypothetical protein [Castellaniella sp.]|uniref:hypothetical protein n=1 Tax=Castellaniella sp. TaxID=1955812 RepID=UPI002AFE359D|nr:hypothetical protein [Castellaniella sp.]
MAFTCGLLVCQYCLPRLEEITAVITTEKASIWNFLLFTLEGDDRKFYSFPWAVIFPAKKCQKNRKMSPLSCSAYSEAAVPLKMWVKTGQKGAEKEENQGGV